MKDKMKEAIKIPKKLTEAKELLVKIKKLSERGLFLKSDRFVHNLHCSLLYGYILNTVGRLMMDAMRITSGRNDYVIHAEITCGAAFSMMIYKGDELVHSIDYFNSRIIIKVSQYLMDVNTEVDLYEFTDYVHLDFEHNLKAIEVYESWLAPILKETKLKKR